MEKEDKMKFLEALTKGGSVNIGQLSVGDHNTMNYYAAEKTPAGYSDEQIAQALANITGKGRPIDSKQKWAGAMWLLRWECNFPAKAVECCERINALPLPQNLEYRCDYNNVRPLATLSFMNEDPRQMEKVRYSKNDETAFFQMREVVLALEQELRKTQE